MATYAIGDIQGCHFSFQHLLSEIQFNSSRDRLWLVGDIVNRGAGSLEVLRWVYQYRDVINLVLGNHDLHALTVAEGFVKAHKGDTLQAILDAPDRDTLLGWLRCQPLIHDAGEYVMVHAGLLPQWSVEKAKRLANEVSEALSADNYRDFLSQMYGNQPAFWNDDLEGMSRLRVITNAITRLRICTDAGVMDFKFKGELPDIPRGFKAWFDIAERQSKGAMIIFGHWSALGLQQRDKLFSLDTGCLWGGQLTALRLEDRALFQVPCSPEDSPQRITPD
jgi:bis(5'-nucleosyl)-tetraphosphatase (symmetrical)